MNIDPRTLAARLGSAVFERIAKDGLLNRELVEDAIYREWLVFVEDQKGATADFSSAERRILAHYADPDATSAPQPTSAKQLALAQHCAAAWRKKAAPRSGVTWSALLPSTRDGWLSVAALILTRWSSGISVWGEDIREAYYKGCGADITQAWVGLPQSSKDEWNAVVEALAAFESHWVRCAQSRLEALKQHYRETNRS